jgi:two-component system OmpR family sensor kinase
MFKSIRWTLQLWHAGILFLALASFGTVLYLAAQRTTYTEVDNELAAAARVLSGSGLNTKPNQSSPSSLQLALASPPAADGSSRIVSDAPPAFEISRSADNVTPIPVWLKNIPQDCLRRLGWSDSDQPYFIIWGSDGSMLRQSTPLPASYPPRPVLRERVGVRASNVMAISSDTNSSTSEFRQQGDFREVLLTGPAGSTIVVGRSIQRETAGLATLRLNLASAGAAVMLIGLLGGYLLSHRVLRPIHLMSDAARSISGSDLSHRIDREETTSELDSLAQTLNETFDRLESAFQRQAQFTADASHELRTPLAVINAGSGLALKRDRSAQEYRQTIESNLRASKRMQSLVDSLLVLARADANALELRFAAIDLYAVVDDCITLVLPVALKKNISINLHGESVRIEADRDRILQLITNLIGNAVQYNRPSGSVTATVCRQNDFAVLTIADTGIGIAAHDQPRVFERFFRVESARTRESGGCGLGLAICKSIVSAHNGTISFTSDPASGTTFTVRLPLAKANGESH